MILRRLCVVRDTDSALRAKSGDCEGLGATTNTTYGGHSEGDWRNVTAGIPAQVGLSRWGERV